ncbi:MAG: hypothetical protein LBQ88_20605 [Treponema sp.]|nr:hypothetical protein [Treponema sp.]
MKRRLKLYNLFKNDAPRGKPQGASLDRKFIILAGSIPRSEDVKHKFRIVTFARQAAGYGPGLPINKENNCYDQP